MISEEKIIIHFSLPFSAKTVFDFIVKPINMPLYEGFLLIPGIKHVDSSDNVRQTGTIDKITNTDGGSHQSRTDILDENKRYSLTISDINLTGAKKNLGSPLTGLREDWIFHEHHGHAHIERTLVIEYRTGLWNKLFIRIIIYPQLYFSLLKHHQNLLKALS